MIFGICFGSIIVIIALSFLCVQFPPCQKLRNHIKYCLRYFLTCSCFSKESKVKFTPSSSTEQFPHQIANMSDTVLGSKWKTFTVPPIHFQNNCAFCQQNRISLQLECGHIYHRRCFILWIKRIEECPICQSTNIYNARIYC